jgi:tetratricopeptide (TPR) repeat protein
MLAIGKGAGDWFSIIRSRAKRSEIKFIRGSMKKTSFFVSILVLSVLFTICAMAKDEERSVTAKDTPKMREAYSYYVLEEKNPAFAYNNEGNFYLIKKQYDMAVAMYKKALDIDPSNALVLNNLSWAMILQGKYTEALDLLKKSIALDPKKASTHFYLGVTYWMLSDIENAKKELETAELLDPNHPYTHFYLSMVYGQQGNIEKAILEGEKSSYILSNIWNPDIALYLGDLYGRAGMFQKAILQYQKLVDEKDYAFRSQYGLGIAYGAFGDSDKAEKHLLKALDLNDKDPMVNYALGKLYSQNDNKLKKALGFAKDALSMEPENPRFLYLVGWVYYRMGDNKDAFEFITKAADKDPENETYKNQVEILKKEIR